MKEIFILNFITAVYPKIAKHRYLCKDRGSSCVPDATTNSPLFRSDCYWHTDTEPFGPVSRINPSLGNFSGTVSLTFRLPASDADCFGCRLQEAEGDDGGDKQTQMVHFVWVGSTVLRDRTVTNNNSTVSRSVLFYCPTNFYYYTVRPRYRRTNRLLELLKPWAPPPGVRKIPSNSIGVRWGYKPRAATGDGVKAGTLTIPGVSGFSGCQQPMASVGYA